MFANTAALTGYECINYVLERSSGTCYIYTTTQQGNHIVADTAPVGTAYAEFDCRWRY